MYLNLNKVVEDYWESLIGNISRSHCEIDIEIGHDDFLCLGNITPLKPTEHADIVNWLSVALQRQKMQKITQSAKLNYLISGIKLNN